LNTPAHRKFFEKATKRLKVIDNQSAPLPDGYVQSNYEAMNALKLAMEKSKFHAREDTMKLIEALEGLEMKESDDFPQGRQGAPQGGSPGVPARVHLRYQGRQAPDRRGGPEGKDHSPASLQVRPELSDCRGVYRCDLPRQGHLRAARCAMRLR